MLEEHAFAAAAGAHDDENFTGADLEVDTIEDLLVAETLVEAADDEADTGGLVVEIVGLAIHSTRRE
jgi:hypothetical protein